MRLIDADELKKLFPDNGEGSWTYNATAKGYIDAQPTAYDPDKVVEELEKEMERSKDRCDWGARFKAFRDAIEIVKGGVE